MSVNMQSQENKAALERLVLENGGRVVQSCTLRSEVIIAQKVRTCVPPTVILYHTFFIAKSKLHVFSMIRFSGSWRNWIGAVRQVFLHRRWAWRETLLSDPLPARRVV